MGLAVMAAVALGACGSSDDPAGRGMMPGTTASPSGTAPAADHGQADVMFSMMMVPHHEQAVEMSALVPSRSEDPELRELAAAIADAQQPEIEQMQGWLRGWGVAAPGDMAGHMGHMGMDGMLSAAELEELESLRGPAFERTWLQGMVRHHEGAIDMAEQVLEDGVHEPTRALARTIITTQQAEITAMQEMLAGAEG